MAFPYPVAGTITDSDGNAVSTKVVLRNDRTGESINTTSNSSGQYLLDAANLASGYMTTDRLTVIVAYGDEDGSLSFLISDHAGGYSGADIEMDTLAESSDCTYCQVQDVLDELGDKTTDDVSYERVRKSILRAEDEIEDRAGTKFSTTTVTQEVYDFNQYTSYKSPENLMGRESDHLIGSRNDYWNTYFNDKIQLKNRPLISVTTLQTNSGGASATDSWTTRTEQTGTGGDFIKDTDTATITFVNNVPAFGKRRVRVTYTYGYASVPKIVERLCILLSVRSILQSKASGSMFDSVDSISLEGISISKGTGNSVTYLNSITSEINELWKEVGELVQEVA